MSNTLQDNPTFIFEDSPENHRRKVSATSIAECRICLEQQFDASMGQSIISPCLCSGSVKYVHFKCMTTWIQRNSSIPLNQLKKKGQFQCQMCKYKIQFQCQSILNCNNLSTIKMKISNKLFNFVILTLLIIVCISLISTGFYMILQSSIISFIHQNIFQTTIVIICIILVIVLLVVSCYLCFFQFVVTEGIVITRISDLKLASPRRRVNSSFSVLNTTENIQIVKKHSKNTAIYPLELMVQNLD